MEEKLKKTLEGDNSSSVKKEVKGYVPITLSETSEAGNPDQDLDKSLMNMDEVDDVSVIEEINTSGECIGLKASKIWEDMKKSFDQASAKLGADAPKAFTFFLDGKTVSVSIHDRFNVKGSGSFTDYHTYVPGKYLYISVYDPKNSTTVNCEIGYWQEKRASMLATNHDWVGVEMTSGEQSSVRKVTAQENCRYDKEFKSANISVSANTFLGLAERVSMQCPNIINTLYKEKQNKNK